MKFFPFSFLIIAMFLTSYSFSQSNLVTPNNSNNLSATDLSFDTIPLQNHELTLPTMNYFVSDYTNYIIPMKVGEELEISVNNPNQTYHSGDLKKYEGPIKIDNYGFYDLSHTLQTAIYPDSWNPWNHTVCIEEEYNLNQETGDPLLYHFKAIRPGKSYIYFGTLKTCHYKYVTSYSLNWMEPMVTVEVSE